MIAIVNILQVRDS